MSSKAYFAYPLVLCLLFSSGCASVGDLLKARPKAKLAGVHFDRAKLNALDLTFDLEVKNPYPVGLPVTGLAYNLSSGEKEFIAGSTEPNVVIPAKLTETIAVPVTVNYGDILRALKGIRPGATIPYNAGVVLSVDTQTFGKIDLPLRRKGEITLPSISGETLRKVWELVN